MLAALCIPLLLAQAPSATETLKTQAKAVEPLVTSQLAVDWLNGVPGLKEPSPRTIYRGTSW
ncbi:MAG: hypothetical protein ABUL49_01900, partial [bacterium]